VPPLPCPGSWLPFIRRGAGWRASAARNSEREPHEELALQAVLGLADRILNPGPLDANWQLDRVRRLLEFLGAGAKAIMASFGMASQAIMRKQFGELAAVDQSQRLARSEFLGAGPELGGRDEDSLGCAFV